jgi:hypothetical protein
MSKIGSFVTRMCPLSLAADEVTLDGRLRSTTSCAAAMTSLIGTVIPGHGKASGTLGEILTHIREESGLLRLRPQTFNVKLAQPFALSSKFTVPYANAVGREDYFF